MIDIGSDPLAASRSIAVHHGGAPAALKVRLPT